MGSINIHISADTAVEAREEMRRLLGLQKVEPYYPDADGAPVEVPVSAKTDTKTAVTTAPPAEQKPLDGEVLTADDARPRGKPGAGRSRRNKAETAEDEALEKLATKAGVSLEQVDTVMSQVNSRAKVIEGLNAKIAQGGTDENKPSISTGENRVGPEDDAETQAQDAADEKAEVEANPSKELTLDDLRAVIGKYVEKFGMAATQEDGKVLLEQALGAAPEGEFWTMSMIGKAGQEHLRKARDAWQAVIDKGERYKAAA